MNKAQQKINVKDICQSMLNDFREMKLNESYIFPNAGIEEDIDEPENFDSEEPIGNDEFDSPDDTMTGMENPTPEETSEAPAGSDDNEVKATLKDFRRNAMLQMANLDPETQAELYKAFKTIYETCDKFLYNKADKQQVKTIN